jgi:hypothetical protein
MGRRQVHRSQGTLIDRGLSSDGLYIYILSRISRARATVYMYYFFVNLLHSNRIHITYLLTHSIKKKNHSLFPQILGFILNGIIKCGSETKG